MKYIVMNIIISHWAGELENQKNYWKGLNPCPFAWTFFITDIQFLKKKTTLPLKYTKHKPSIYVMSVGVVKW